LPLHPIKQGILIWIVINDLSLMDGNIFGRILSAQFN